MEAKIAESLTGLREDIELFLPFPDNPRDGDVGAISESLRRFGQQKPIVVQASSMRIVAGNHLWKAAKALRWTEIAANVVDLDDKDAEAFLIADNRTAELGAYDEDAMGRMLRKLAVEGNLRGTGYDGDDVDALLRRLEKEGTKKVEPEIAFREELLEEHQYVVLVFENEIDWSVAKAKLGLVTVTDEAHSETYSRKGQARVVVGADVMAMIP